MYIERKQDLSMYYLLDNLFAPYDFVKIVDDFPSGNLDLPTISVENTLYTVDWYELGTRKGIDVRAWYINVFAKNKSQRDDYAYLIKNTIQNGIPVYDYDEGFPPDISPSQIGAMEILELRVDPIRVDSDMVSTLYWRAQITVVARYTKPQE